MTREDFQARVKRVDPQYFRHGPRKIHQSGTARPFLFLSMGFAWAYLVISVARNRAYVEQSLLQGSLPAEYHGYIFHGLAALLSVSAVMMLLHLFRYCLRRSGPAKRNSGGLLMGATAAALLVYTPPGVFETGFGMLDDNSRAVILAASSGVKNAVPVDFASVAFVSSQGNY
ncbi:hypothetical protein M4578_00645 [Salipiger sp. P9]|nr:hypothetical protein [Salipiger pentaromativorans]